MHTTSERPFFTVEQGFVSAGQLKLGMHILRADGSVGVVTGWKAVRATKVMYNLEVAYDHTFVVGDGQWVVHNTCSSGPLRRALCLKSNTHYQAQHLIPCEFSTGRRRAHSLVMIAENGNLNYLNGAWNGVGLPDNPALSTADGLPFHYTNHNNYTDQVEDLLNRIWGRLSQQATGGLISVASAQGALDVLASYLRFGITQAGGGVCINDVNVL